MVSVSAGLSSRRAGFPVEDSHALLTDVALSKPGSFWRFDSLSRRARTGRDGIAFGATLGAGLNPYHHHSSRPQ